MAPWCIHISCLERVARSGSGRDSVRGLVGAMDAELSRPDWLAIVQSGRKQVQSRVCTPSFRQPLCLMVGRRPQHAVSKLPCLVLSFAISCRSSIYPGRLSIAWVVSLVFFYCHNYGLHVVTREVHRSSLRRLICPAQDHFTFLTVLIISMTFVLSLTQMLVFLSVQCI